MDEHARNVNIDIMKAIAVFAVCYTHFNSFDLYEVDEWFTLKGIVGYSILIVSACAVPIFLIINGYLVILKEYSLRRHIAKAANVIIVTFTWGIVYNIVFSKIFHEKLDAAEIMRRLQEGAVYRGGYINIRNWFFWALAIIYLLLPIINNIFTKCSEDIKIYTFFLVAVFTMGNDLVLKISLVLAKYCGVEFLEFSTFMPRLNFFSSWDSFALVYFMLGAFLHRRKSDRNYLRKTYYILIIVLCFVGNLFFAMWYMKAYKVYYDVIWNNYSNILTLMMAMSFFDLQIVQKNERKTEINKLATHISKNSMGIYFFHLLIGTLIKPLYLKLPFNKMLLSGLLYAGIVFVLADIACSITKRIPLLRRMVSL